MRLLSQISLSAMLGLSVLSASSVLASAAVVPAQTAVALRSSTSEIAPAAFRGGARIFIPHGGMHGFGNRGFGNRGFGGPGFHRYGRNLGPFLGGLGTGVLLGAPGYDYGYDYDYGYGYPGGYGYGVPGGYGYDYPPEVATPAATVAYCVRRFRSYDPASRTYAGADGLRHRCP